MTSGGGGVILCTYTIQFPPPPPSALTPTFSDVTDPSAGALSGALRVCVSGTKLTLRDVTAAWPFEGAFHFRAQLSPPGEAHVFLDLVDGLSTLVPLLADGSASIRALPLATLNGLPLQAAQGGGETWVWSAEDFTRWNVDRAAKAAAASRVAVEREMAAADGSSEGSPGIEDGNEGGGDDDSGDITEGAWGADSGRDRDTEGSMREAAAVAAAALKQAGAAAGAAMSSMSSMFGRAAAAVKQRMT